MLIKIEKLNNFLIEAPFGAVVLGKTRSGFLAT